MSHAGVVDVLEACCSHLLTLCSDDSKLAAVGLLTPLSLSKAT